MFEKVNMKVLNNFSYVSFYYYFSKLYTVSNCATKMQLI